MQRLQEGLAAVRAQQPGDTVPALTFLLASPDEQVRVPARMCASPGADVRESWRSCEQAL